MAIYYQGGIYKGGLDVIEKIMEGKAIKSDLTLAKNYDKIYYIQEDYIIWNKNVYDWKTKILWSNGIVFKCKLLKADMIVDLKS